MANLHVRNVPEDVAKALKLRAQAKGHSAEAEHRALLQEILVPDRAAFVAEVRRIRQRIHDEGQDSPSEAGDMTALVRELRDES